MEEKFRSSGRTLCRHFLSGSCRRGHTCPFSHDLPPSLVCRYFQKGGCWFGERCRYLHVPAAAVGSRRGSAPVVPSARAGPVPSPRRGSEPLLTGVPFQNLRITEQEQPGSNPHRALPADPQRDVTSVSNSPREAKPHGASPLGDGDQQEAAAAPSCSTEAYQQSRDVCCGICMDKVYEKTSPQERRFGILPNCNHAFCLGCIVTWRKSKDFQQEIIKACPQCRVKSSYYIPSNYWVSEGDRKQLLISTFKERSSKTTCSFYMRDGCCPFKSDCIYSHKLPSGFRPRPRRPSHAVWTSSLEEEEDDDEEELDSDSLELLQYIITIAFLDEVSGLLDDSDDELYV